MRKILPLLCLLPLCAEAAKKPVSVDAPEPPRDFNHRASHWVATFNVEHMRYELPFSFEGAKGSFKTEDRAMGGFRAGFGREQHLGGGVLFGVRADGYYLGTFLNDVKVAKDDDVDVDISHEVNQGYLYGGEAVAHLGKMFDFKTRNPFLGEMNYLAWEPYSEASLGYARASNSKHYWYSLAGTDERYKATIKDEIATGSVSGGVNILSVTSGFFLNLKFTWMVHRIINRDMDVDLSQGGNTGAEPESSDTVSMAVYSIGGGYKF